MLDDSVVVVERLVDCDENGKVGRGMERLSLAVISLGFVGSC